MPYFYGNPTLIQRFQHWLWKKLGLNEVLEQFEDELIDLWREVDYEAINTLTSRPDQHDFDDLEDEVSRLRQDLFSLSDDVAEFILKDFGITEYEAYGFEDYNPEADPEYPLLDPVAVPDPEFSEAIGLAAEAVLPSALASDPQWDEEDCI
jgi:hypothetical protein